MNILYKNTKVEKQFSAEYKSAWKYPKQVQIKLEAAENYIKKAASLIDVANYPPFRFEKLKGDRKNEWSIRLGNTGYRITLYPCCDDGKEMIGGDIMPQCRNIKIIMITEVSNHYE